MAHRFQRPRALLVCALLSLPLATAGCQYMPCVGGYGNCEPDIVVDVEQTKGFSPCLPAFGSEIISADMNAAGTRILTVTSAKPARPDTRAEAMKPIIRYFQISTPRLSARVSFSSIALNSAR